MKDFRVLFLEHEPERVVFRQAMEAAPATVFEIEYRDRDTFLTQLKERVHGERFDLVVTDAVFLPEGEMHASGVDGEYLLDEIVATVRAVDRYRTKIAVLTQFGDDLFSPRYVSTLDSVDFVWSKPDINLAYLTFAVRRVRDELQRRFPIQTLIDVLLDRINSDMPWSKEMARMLQDYVACRGELTKIEMVDAPLRAIASRFEVDSEVGKLLQMFAGAESIQIAAKPRAWGHLRHVVNVFWLGYLLFNSELLDPIDTWRVATKQGGDCDSPVLREELNFAWLLAGLFHDVGLLGERFEDLAKRCDGLAKLYPVGEWKLDATSGFSHSDSAVVKSLARVTNYMSPELSAWFNSTANSAPKGIDHGVLSGLTIMATLEEKGKLPPRVAGMAAAAAAVHNLAKLGFGGSADPLPEVSFETDPIVAMLLVCDQLQVWERDTGLETIFSEISLEAVEFSPIELDDGKRKFHAVTNYCPPREIRPNEVKMTGMRNELTKKISDDVLPILRRVSWSKTKAPDIEVKFMLDGRENVGTWTTGASDR